MGSVERAESEKEQLTSNDKQQYNTLYKGQQQQQHRFAIPNDKDDDDDGEEEEKIMRCGALIDSSSFVRLKSFVLRRHVANRFIYGKFIVSLSKINQQHS